MPADTYSVTINQSRRAGGIGALPAVTDEQIDAIADRVVQVISSDVILGSDDCPVTIYPPNGNLAPTYVESTGAANTALLNTLFTNWGESGEPTGRVIFPAGVLHTTGTVVAPRQFSGVFLGAGGRSVALADTREPCQGLSEWYMQKATGATGFRPGFACQSVGIEFQNLLLRSRRRVLAGDSWTDTSPSAMVYVAAITFASTSAPGYFNGFETSSGLGTGKLKFVSCTFQNGASTPCVQQGVVDTPSGSNADTLVFETCFFSGSGSSLVNYQAQSIENTFNDCYWEVYDSPIIANIYKGGGVHFNGGTVTEPCTLVKLQQFAGTDSSSWQINFDRMKIDNTAVPGFKFFDGSLEESFTYWFIRVNGCHWPFETIGATDYFLKMGANQRAVVRDCMGVQAPLFTTYDRTSGSTTHGETAGYQFRSVVDVRDCHCRVTYGAPPTLSSLRHSGDSEGTEYRFSVSGCTNDAMKPFLDEEFGS